MSGRSDESLETRPLRGGRLLHRDGDRRGPRRALPAEDDGGVPVVLRRIRPGARRRIAGQVPRRHHRERVLDRHRARPPARRGPLRAGRGPAQRSRAEHRRRPKAPRIAVPPELRVQLGSAGITGVKFILIDFFSIADNPIVPLPFPVPDNYIPSARSTMKNLEDSVVHAVDRFPEVARPARRRAGKDRPHPGGRRRAPPPREARGGAESRGGGHGGRADRRARGELAEALGGRSADRGQPERDPRANERAARTRPGKQGPPRERRAGLERGGRRGAERQRSRSPRSRRRCETSSKRRTRFNAWETRSTGIPTCCSRAGAGRHDEPRRLRVRRAPRAGVRLRALDQERARRPAVLQPRGARAVGARRWPGTPPASSSGWDA